MRLTARLRRITARLRREALLLPLALLACLLSAAALVSAVARGVPQPALIAPQDRLAMVGVELLLPHLSRSAPFPRPYALALSLAEGDAELTLLLRGIAPLAASGAPMPRALAEAFPPVAEATIAYEAGFHPNGDFAVLAARAMRLGAAIGMGGSPALEAARQAEAALARGDILAADAAMDGLNAPPVLVAWRAQVAMRLRADTAATRLIQLATARAGVP
ncbi:hypothetical protein ACQW02_10490 [Humitalea sp. 24SJ18S-53]|uniref:hypothetical protein n=1 Tax=Humitalea sp. 24SJ18S-53 TaxID=3422307 RepID=UPI003D676841